jgi:hypothetical protein
LGGGCGPSQQISHRKQYILHYITTKNLAYLCCVG